jgi:hypothetical protein
MRMFRGTKRLADTTSRIMAATFKWQCLGHSFSIFTGTNPYMYFVEHTILHGPT